MPKTRTPIIKPRKQGGTFYTFASALEDVGLNINELKNKVSLSHYVLLNIPAFDVSTSYPADCNPGDYTFAEQFQNYALNMEAVLRNQDNYNFASSLTVSERVFWKWMQKQGYVTFEEDKDASGNLTGYYKDSATFTEESTVKGFGLISSGAQRTDAYGIYNETFVQIPSSYGQSIVLFKPVSDKNYYLAKDEKAFQSKSNNGYIEFIDASTELDASGNLHTGIPAKAIYDDDTRYSYVVENETDELCVEFSLSALRKYYDDETLTYDDIAMGDSSIFRPEDVTGNFLFNAILVYYSIYDSTGKNILATNAYGLLLLDSAEPGIGEQYQFKELPKKKGDIENSGNSYSFRLNIKTSSVYNGDITVSDNSTPAYQMSTDFNETIRNLAVAVETLRSNANLISALCTQNTNIKELVVKSLDKIDDIESDIKALKSGKMRELKVATMTTDALAAKTLDSSLKIDDYGKIDGSVFEYENIEAGTVRSKDGEIDAIITKSIIGKDGEISLGEAGRITSAGMYTDNLFLFSTNNQTDDRMNAADASTILGSLTVLKDGNFYIDSPTASTNDSASNIGTPEETEAEMSDTLEGVNTKLLLGALITKVNSMELFDMSNVSDSSVADFLDRIEEALDVKDDVSTNQENISKLDSSVQAIDSSVSAIDSSLGTVDSSVRNLDSSVSALDSSVKVLDSSVSALETAANNLHDSIDILDSSVNKLFNHDNSIDASIQSIDTHLNNIDASLNNLETLICNILTAQPHGQLWGIIQQMIEDYIPE